MAPRITANNIREIFLDEFASTTEAEGTSLTESNFNRIFNDLYRGSWSEEALRGNIENRRRNNNNMAYASTMNYGDSQARYLSTLANLENAPYNEQGNYSITNLTEKQKWMIQQLLRRKKENLLGKEYKIVGTRDGRHTTRNYKGTMVAVADAEEGTPLDSLMFSIHLEDDTLYDAKIYQLEPVAEAKFQKLTQKELTAFKKSQETKVVVDALAAFNRQANTEFRKAAEDIEYLKREKANYLRQIEKYDKDIKHKEGLVASGKESKMDLKGLAALVASINKQDKVEDAYIGIKGNLVVFTKMLYGLDSTGKEDKSVEIGRFIFRMPLIGLSPIAFNLDYAVSPTGSDPYWHPNIRGTNICQGDNAKEILGAARAGQLYELVDFLIIFLSLYPHDGGNPYIGFPEWLQQRTRLRASNNGTLKRYWRDFIEMPLFKTSKSFEAVKKELEEKKVTREVTLSDLQQQFYPDPAMIQRLAQDFNNNVQMPAIPQLEQVSAIQSAMERQLLEQQFMPDEEDEDDD